MAFRTVAWILLGAGFAAVSADAAVPAQGHARAADLRAAAVDSAGRGDRAAALGHVRQLVARDPQAAAEVLKEPKVAALFYEGRALVSLEPSQIRVKSRPPLPLAPALHRNRTSVVLVELVVDADGLPLRAEALDGPRELWHSAEAYTVQWALEPQNPPVLARLLVLIPFQGEGGSPPTFRAYEGPQEPPAMPYFRRKL